jgi:hypothetical protein
MAERAAYPAWVRWPYTLFVLVLVPVYWRDHGPANFLWFSDIALFALLLSLWTGWRLPYSMMAVGVLPFEIMWVLDFMTGGNLTGIAAYMFSDDDPLYLRILSGFHFFIPPIAIWMLFRQGYDPRALPAQSALAAVVLPLTWLVSGPDDNINWVYGPGFVQDFAPAGVYLTAYLALLFVLVHLPMHWLLRRYFGRTPGPWAD